MKLKSMTIILLLMQLLLLLLVSSGADCRAVPIEELDHVIVDNSIDADAANDRSNTFEESWLKFVQYPLATVTQRSGRAVRLVCVVIGSGAVDVKWRDGNWSRALLNDLRDNAIMEPSKAIKSVRAVHIVEHALHAPQTYTCIGRVGLKVLTSTTTVQPPEEKSHHVAAYSHKPFITLMEQSHMDAIGNDVLLPCRVHSLLPYKRQWFVNTVPIALDDSRMKMLSNGDLLIQKVAWRDMGSYRCAVKNMYGRDEQETFLYPMKD